MNSRRFIQFCKGLDEHIELTFGTLLAEIAAQEQTVIAKLSEAASKSSWKHPEAVAPEIRLSYPKLFSKRNLIKYSILSWYMAPQTAFELQNILQKKAYQLHFPEVLSYLHSREVMLGTLFLENDLTLGDLFGNLLTNGIFETITDSSGKKIRVKKPDKVLLHFTPRCPPKKKVFRRGYNDHGSMADSSTKARRKADEVYGTQAYLELELERIKESLESKIRINEVILFLGQLEGVEK